MDTGASERPATARSRRSGSAGPLAEPEGRSGHVLVVGHLDLRRTGGARPASLLDREPHLGDRLDEPTEILGAGRGDVSHAERQAEPIADPLAADPQHDRTRLHLRRLEVAPGSRLETGPAAPPDRPLGA